MARIVLVALLVLLVSAPVAEASVSSRGESPDSGWLGFLRTAFDWLFSRAPAIRSAPKKSGALIVPDGLSAPPPAQRAGALIVPDGARRPGQMKR